ncbi:MAG: NADAR family protein [Flavobacteriales bacterium]|nr:NADAR family protein [Flavobacteriales bacterium]
MHASTHIRVYNLAECITFRKTNESFGGLSNMASGYVLWVNNTRILTTEAIYQACRFPHMPEVQRSIIMQGSPMTAKMKSKPFRDQSRADWNNVRLGIMRWCLRVKLAHHWDKFGELLLRTGDKPIVEDSRKDQFWGAVMNESGQLEGRNALGRLLMELREELKGPERERLRTVKPLDIPEFLLYGQLIGLVEARATKAEEDTTGRRLKPLGTRRPDEPVKTYAPPAAKADLFSEPEDPMQEKEPKPKAPSNPTPPTSPPAYPGSSRCRSIGSYCAQRTSAEVNVRSKTGKEDLLSVC